MRLKPLIRSQHLDAIGLGAGAFTDAEELAHVRQRVDRCRALANTCTLPNTNTHSATAPRHKLQFEAHHVQSTMLPDTHVGSLHGCTAVAMATSGTGALQSRWPPVEPVQSDRWPHSQLHALDLKERVIAFIGRTRPARTNPDGSACWKRVQVRKQTQTQRLSASRAWKRSLRTLKSVLCSFWTCF